MRAAFLLFLGGLAAGQAQLADSSAADLIRVHERINDVPVLDIRVRNFSAERLVNEIARRMGYGRVEGFELIQEDHRVTVNLQGRTLHDTLRWSLGSVGLVATVSRDTIKVAPDVGAYPDSRAMLEKAERRYFNAIKRFPEYPLLADAMMDRGIVCERMGHDRWVEAIHAYDNLIEEFPTNQWVPEAMLRTARLAGQLGDWTRAVQSYEELAKLNEPHPYHATARHELASALCHQGEADPNPIAGATVGRRATYVLDALDVNYPTDNYTQRYERLLIRARGEALAGNAVEALQNLDLAAEKYAPNGGRDPRILELRARALARAGKHVAAAKGWLHWADQVEGEAQADGYEYAAEEALEAGEELMVIMIHGSAEKAGHGKRLAPYAAIARSRLGLMVHDVDDLGAVANLARGEAHYVDRRYDAAVEVLKQVFKQREDLSPEELVRLARCYAYSLNKRGLHDAAIDVLRAIAMDLDRESDRREIYLLAADLYESRNLNELAIEALRGRL